LTSPLLYTYRHSYWLFPVTWQLVCQSNRFIWERQINSASL